MKRVGLCLVLFLGLLAVPALAVLPENGLYYSPEYPALGFSIDVQGTTMVMVTFAYDHDTGEPLFYTSAGQITRAVPRTTSLGHSYKHEYPYRFEAPLYRYVKGPCITCFLPEWDTSAYAVPAGRVQLRMPDVNRIMATFTMTDGSSRHMQLVRFGFGRAVYDLGREDGRRLLDMRGTWVFVQRSDTQASPWRFNFTEVHEPEPVANPFHSFYGRHVPTKMSFVDPDADAELTCTRYGCALTQHGETLFLVKFVDIGMDSLLGYVGDELFPDDGAHYRTGELIIGKHVIDPTPKAAPPPED